jgi:regulator of PEP synthase PpsR (kinase-PPPase family)
VISDSTGETAKFLFSKVLETYEAAQRPGVTLYGYVTKPMELAEILATETSNGYSEVYVVATLVEPSMIRWVEKLSVDLGIKNLNLMKPMLDEFNIFLGSQAQGKAGAVDGSSSIVMQQLDDLVSKEFLGMVDAANFVRSRSDARRPAEWQDADIILVGVSRSGKTSVASFLAQRGKKAACVRIAADKPIPEGLGTADPSKVVLITRSVEHILKRRKNRVSLWEAKSVSSTLPNTLENYATPDKVQKDMELFDQLSRSHPEWMGPLDCTYACEDETSSQILGALTNRAKPKSVAAAPVEDPPPSLPLLALVPAAIAFGIFLG